MNDNNKLLLITSVKADEINLLVVFINVTN